MRAGRWSGGLVKGRGGQLLSPWDMRLRLAAGTGGDSYLYAGQSAPIWRDTRLRLAAGTGRFLSFAGQSAPICAGHAFEVGCHYRGRFLALRRGGQLLPVPGHAFEFGRWFRRGAFALCSLQLGKFSCNNAGFSLEIALLIKITANLHLFTLEIQFSRDLR
jgi:hypothetical protein